MISYFRKPTGQLTCWNYFRTCFYIQFRWFLHTEYNSEVRLQVGGCVSWWRSAWLFGNSHTWAIFPWIFPMRIPLRQISEYTRFSTILLILPSDFTGCVRYLGIKWAYFRCHFLGGVLGGPLLGLCLDPLRAENRALPTQKGVEWPLLLQSINPLFFPIFEIHAVFNSFAWSFYAGFYKFSLVGQNTQRTMRLASCWG